MAAQIETDLGEMTLSPSAAEAKDQDREEKTNAEVDPKHTCATCATPAKLCCTNCQTIPSSIRTQNENKDTWYCSKKCQDQDWPNHKRHCEKVSVKQDLIGLQRATKLLQALFNEHRRVTYDLYIKSVEHKGDTLYIQEGNYNIQNYLLTILPGFDHVEPMLSDPKDRETMLAIMSCNDSLVRFYGCCILLLQDTKITKTVEELSVDLIPGPRVWEYKRPWATSTSDQMTRHALYLVTLNDDTQWTVDLTAAQYGYAESLTPWNEYLGERVKELTKIYPFGNSLKISEANIAAFMRLTTMVGVNIHVDINKKVPWTQHQISEVIKPSIESILKDHGVTTREFLRTLPEDEFEKIFQEIIHVVGRAMRELKKEMDEVKSTIEKMRIVKKRVAMAARVVLSEEDLPPMEAA